MFIVLATTLPWQAAACSAPACNTFREVYNNGENLCNKVWGDYYKYETDEANAFSKFKVQPFETHFVHQDVYAAACNTRERTSGKGKPTHTFACLFASTTSS